MAGRERAERAAYAQVIAGFAAGDRLAGGLALATPMVCPVLGETSIIHRLRSLSMAEVSQRRRRMGMTLLAAKASVGYWQGEVSPVPASLAEAQKREASHQVAIVPPAIMQEPQEPAPKLLQILAEAKEANAPQPVAKASAIAQAVPAAVQMPTTPVAFVPQNQLHMEVRCAGRDGAILCQTTQVLVSLHPVDNAPHLIRAGAVQIRRYTVTAPLDAADLQDAPGIGKTV